MSRLFDIPNVIDTDDWYTPPWVFDGMGITFDLDVATPDNVIPWIPTRNRYTVADDGLTSPWFGTVWCNPPYSETRPWCRKWAAHPSGALCVMADLSSGGQFYAFTRASSIYIPDRRLQFVSPDGSRSRGAHFSAVIMGRGATVDAALFRLAETHGGTARLLTEDGR